MYRVVACRLPIFATQCVHMDAWVCGTDVRKVKRIYSEVAKKKFEKYIYSIQKVMKVLVKFAFSETMNFPDFRSIESLSMFHVRLNRHETIC